MKVLFGVGVDSIHFGISENEAVKSLGKPDKVYVTDANCRRLQYNDLKLELSFEPDNGDLLGWIEVHNPDAELFGTKLICLEKKEVLRTISKHLDEQPELDDYGSFISVTYEDKWLELQFHFERLQSISFGVLYNEFDKPQWPAT